MRTAVTGGTMLLAVVGITLMFGTAASSETKDFSRFVDAKGGIRLPEDFRKNMVHLGSWFVPEGDASGFHDVYTEASTVEAYRKTGEFPDGATLIKELRGSTAGTYTTGANVSYANDTLKQWFVLIKDRQGRFPDNANWGDGWGWALIKPDDPSKNVSMNYQASCLGCHIPAKANDWIYVEAYPTLRK
jgi:hypothetical protein